MTERSETTRRTNFLTKIIEADLEAGKYDAIVTRFPPEPNGYLHIGHAASICLNFGLAEQYAGRCHLRFDDTNPTTEETEYVNSIKSDVQWLGFEWGEHLYFASDYFERMYQLAELLIEKGKAYVDSTDRDTVREYRGTISEPGRPTPDRSRSVAENLELFRRMRAGEFADGEYVLRAKIDLANPNMLMRDPVLYRIQHASHHATGDEWCIYPLYDYAHCLEDAFEGVTHSICTLEFENNRELYDWVIEQTEVPWQPHQYEFARFNIEYFITSKRKLLQLVNEEHVSGWDDPRMPTIAGLRRRGIRPDAIRALMSRVEVNKTNAAVEMEYLDFAVRDDLNLVAPRVMCVVDPLKVTITNWPDDEVDWLDCSYYPHDVPKEGSRKVPFSGHLYIERDDFMLDPPNKFYRLSPGAEVRLRYGYYITCDEVVTDESGEVVELKCTYDPKTRGGSSPDGRKVKGTIHWVSRDQSLPCEIRVYDRLFTVPAPTAHPEKSFLEFLNPESLVIKAGFVEPSVADDDPSIRYQFERQGYFWQDPRDSEEASLVFNRIVALRDSWAKRREEALEELQQELSPEEPEEPKRDSGDGEARTRKPASYERDQRRAENPELAARLLRYQDELGLDYDDADLLSGYVGIAEFYEVAIAAYDAPESVAKWIVNTLLPAVDDDPDFDELKPTAEQVASLVRAVDDDRITSAVSESVLGTMLETGDEPDAIIRDQGLETVSDSSELSPVIDQILAANPDEVGRYRDGKRALIGFFIGQVMQATGGTADAASVRELLQSKLADD